MEQLIRKWPVTLTWALQGNSGDHPPACRLKWNSTKYNYTGELGEWVQCAQLAVWRKRGTKSARRCGLPQKPSWEASGWLGLRAFLWGKDDGWPDKQVAGSCSAETEACTQGFLFSWGNVKWGERTRDIRGGWECMNSSIEENQEGATAPTRGPRWFESETSWWSCVAVLDTSQLAFVRPVASRWQGLSRAGVLSGL